MATAVLTGATDIGAAIVDADLLLVDDGAGGTLRKTAASRLKTYIGSNTPAFLAYANADQGSISQNTYTKLTNYGAEVFDTDNAFASSRFTPGVVGKYFIYGTVYGTAADGTRNFLSVYLNGSTHYQTSTHIPGGNNILHNKLPQWLM